MHPFCNKVYNLIRDDDQNNIAANIFDFFIIILIVITVIIGILDTFPMPRWFLSFSKTFEVVSIAIFSAEYVLRIWTAPCMYPSKTALNARRKYAFSFMALIDILAVLPFYLPFIFSIDLRILRALRIMRLFRIFKMNRYTHALDVIAIVFKKKARELISSMVAVSIIMFIASVLMYYIEQTVQPDKFNNAFSGLWWTIATLTTVGYGDIYPITGLGRILGAIIALLGIALVAVPTGIISAGFVEEFEADKKPKPVLSVADEIRKFKALLDDGIITEEEFLAQKFRLLKSFQESPA